MLLAQDVLLFDGVDKIPLMFPSHSKFGIHLQYSFGLYCFLNHLFKHSVKLRQNIVIVAKNNMCNGTVNSASLPSS